MSISAFHADSPIVTWNKLLVPFHELSYSISLCSRLSPYVSPLFYQQLTSMNSTGTCLTTDRT